MLDVRSLSAWGGARRGTRPARSVTRPLLVLAAALVLCPLSSCRPPAGDGPAWADAPPQGPGVVVRTDSSAYVSPGVGAFAELDIRVRVTMAQADASVPVWCSTGVVKYRLFEYEGNVLESVYNPVCVGSPDEPGVGRDLAMVATLVQYPYDDTGLQSLRFPTSAEKTYVLALFFRRAGRDSEIPVFSNAFQIVPGNR